MRRLGSAFRRLKSSPCVWVESGTRGPRLGSPRLAARLGGCAIAQLRTTLIVMTTETLGQRIKKERLAQAMTQRDLAEAAGITVPYVSKIEAGKETPTEEKIIRLAEALRLDADELTLAAGRVPQDVMNQLTADPKKALEFLRTMPK